MPSGRANVEITHLLVHRIVPSAVHRKREHPGIVLKNLRGAVALVDVQSTINARSIRPSSRRAAAASAKSLSRQTFAPVAVSVVGAAGNVEGHARFKGVPGTFNRSAHDHHLALNQRLDHGKPGPALPPGATARRPSAWPSSPDRAPGAPLSSPSGVGEKNWRFGQRAFVHQLLGHELVFLHGKAMPLGQRVCVIGVPRHSDHGAVYSRMNS